VMVPSKIDSPIWGMITSVAIFQSSSIPCFCAMRDAVSRLFASWII